MLQISVDPRGSQTYQADQSNSKGTCGHAPTPAFSAAFKSPELDLSAKQPHNALNKQAQQAINTFEANMNCFRERAALKQGSQGSEIHQIDSLKAPFVASAGGNNAHAANTTE